MQGHGLSKALLLFMHSSCSRVYVCPFMCVFVHCGPAFVQCIPGKPCVGERPGLFHRHTIASDECFLEATLSQRNGVREKSLLVF